MRIGLYPGSFDPITNGHVDIIRRSFALVDRLVVAIGVSATKKPFLPLEDRFDLIRQVCGPLADELGCELQTSQFSGLVVEAAREAGATVLIRGLRDGIDLSYETPMVSMNRTMAPEVETVFLTASPETSFISSTLVRQIAGMGGDFEAFVPGAVAAKMKERAAG